MTRARLPRPGVRSALAATCAAALASAAALAAPAGAADTGDPLSSAQWGLDQVRAPAAWATSTGAGAVIAVLDSGVDLGHEDLDATTLTGASFVGCADDGPCGTGDWETEDGGDPHGTHVAGIAAAETGNGLGVAGVAPGARILPVRVLGPDGSGTQEEIAAGIRWATAQGADVINLSLGSLPGTQVFTLTGTDGGIQEAVQEARAAGVVVVAAAGNEFQVPLCDPPAFSAGALCVTATDAREAPASYGNGGINQELLSVAAPGGSGVPVCGEDVVSTVPMGTSVNGETCGWGPHYDESAGTSMASPHVAGVAALLAAMGLTDDEVVDVLVDTARHPVTGARGVFTPQYGWGIVDAQAAVAEALARGGVPATGSGTDGSTDGGSTKPGKGGGNGKGGGKKG